MIASLDIKNLRGIREGKLEGLAALTVLVGPNGCGKSTILDALHTGSHAQPAHAVIHTVQRHRGVREGAKWLAWRADETRIICIELMRHAVGPSRRRTLQFVPTDPRDVARLVLQESVAGIQLADATVIFHRDGTYSYEHTGNFTKSVSEARMVAAYTHEPEPLHTLYSRSVRQGHRAQVLGLLQELRPDLRDLVILTEGENPILHSVYDDYSVPVALAGDGIHALVRLALELGVHRDGLVLAEEPEVHQHPGSMRQIARAILTAVRREIQVVLTTHSLEFIDYLLAETKDDELDKLCVFRVRLDQGQLITARLAGRDVAHARTQIQDDLR